jgi:uncharacterized protein (TIGR03435 family)
MTTLTTRFVAVGAICLLILSGALSGQKAGASQSFDAASIKRNSTQPQIIGGRCRGVDSRPPGGNPASNVPLGRCVLRWMSLSQLVGLAYGDERGLRITGGPAWIDTERFSVEATSENPATTTEASLREMLRNLLADRFKLKLRTERREVTGFALVVARNGSKLVQSAYSGGRSGTFGREAGTLVGLAVGMPALAEELSFWLQRPVVDETGLTGAFDIRLRWTPGMGEVPLPPIPPAPGPVPNAVDKDPEPPSMAVAIQQLGLRLEPKKVSVDYLVIDNAERLPPR